MATYTNRVVYIEVEVIERAGSGEAGFSLGGEVAVMVTTGGSYGEVFPGCAGGG